MWRDLRYRLGGFIRLRMRRSLSRTLAAASSCAVVQEATLRRILRLNATSRFSRLHELHRVNNPTELRRALPICGYDVFESAIVEMRQGDQAALLGEHNRLLMFALTSGTTASTKFIPVTRSFLGDYRRGWQNWGIRAFVSASQPDCHALQCSRQAAHAFGDSVRQHQWVGAIDAECGGAGDVLHSA